MSQSASIFVGEANGYSWIRVCGRGDVFLAPTLKKFTDKLLSAPSEAAPRLVMDMEDCSGMDSTFMGMLASLAIKMKGVANAGFQLCGVTEKNKDSLEELGLDSLIEINPTHADWAEAREAIRSKLSCWSPDEPARPDSDLVLDTHKILGNLSNQNQEKFLEVVKTLENKKRS